MINKPPVPAPNPPPLFTRPRPAPRNEDRVVYAIGSKVIVTANVEGQRTVDLMDEKGHPSPLRVKVETRTEVTAWRPQRSGAARYRIRAEDGTEGWIEAANVRRVPPPPRPVMVASKIVPVVAKAPRKPKAAAKPKVVVPGAVPAIVGKAPATLPAQVATKLVAGRAPAGPQKPPPKPAPKQAPKVALKTGPKTVPKTAAKRPAAKAPARTKTAAKKSSGKASTAARRPKKKK